MPEKQIVISPYNISVLLECRIHKRVNDHTTAFISGIISEEDANRSIESCGESQPLQIRSIDESGGSKTLFNGLVTDLKIQSVNELKKISIRAVSRTFLLDVKKHVRTFQNEKQTFRSVLDTIASLDHAVFIDTTGEAETTNSMVVQYQETDWEFIKRMASWLNTVVVADCENNSPCVCFGIQERGKKYELQSEFYDMEKSVGKLIRKKENNVSGLMEQDAVSRMIETRKAFDLCSPVVCQNRLLYVYEMETILQKGELMRRCFLRTANGFKTQKQFNESLIGLSLNGKITGISKDKVTVNITEDENNDNGTKWFPYSTVYSSPDGTGWYCMPEKGDAVRVYFPNEKEGDAFVISSVHKGGSPMRSDPNVKSLRTKYGKEVVFHPGSIAITNHSGMSVLMDDQKGITILSDKDVCIQSKDTIKMSAAANIDLQGEKGIQIEQNSNRIDVKDAITLNAQKIQHR